MNHICISLTTLKKKNQSHKLLIDYMNKKKSIFIPSPHQHSVCHTSVLKPDCPLNKYFSPEFAPSAQDASQKIYRKGIHLPNNYWVGQKVRSVFSVRWLQQHLVVFNFIQNNFVRLYVTAVISVYILRKTSKLVDFCVAILILKTEEKSNFFSILCCIISRKVKTQPKCKKRFVQCMEKVL